MLKVKQVFDDSGQRYGAEKIWVVLADSGIHVRKKRITAIIQYISKTFSTLLQVNGVKQLSATAKPLDNAVAETFFSTFKREEAYRREYTSERHFQRSVEEYIRYYNETRPHQTLNFKTPQAFEAAFQSRLTENQCSNE